MDEEEFEDMVSEQYRVMEGKIADVVASVAYNQCLDCKDKANCWSNPIEGVARTISPIIKEIDNGKSRIISQSTSRLLLLIKKNQKT